MKKVLILFLVVSLVISVAGCARKSDYEKLLDEKAAVEKKCNELTSEKERLKSETAARQAKIKTLEDTSRKTKASVQKVTKDLNAAKAEIADLQAELAKAKAKAKGL